MTEEQEYQIAENIFEWWISGKSYKKWYSEKFLQLKIEFNDNEDLTCGTCGHGTKKKL